MKDMFLAPFAHYSDALKFCNSESHIPFFSDLLSNTGMKTNAEIRRLNLIKAIGLAGSAQELADKARCSPAYLSQVKNQSPDSKTGKPKSLGDDVAERIEDALRLGRGWMDVLHDEQGRPIKNVEAGHPMRRVADFGLISAEDTDGEVGEIEYWDAKGSCGGGFLNYEQLPKGHLVKEGSFFSRYNVRPSNLFAIYADGDSMADFIVDGDIVIFDKTKTMPVSGKIFLIEHPDGLRIKELRREIGGTWVLESRNPKYPAERISPSEMEHVRICGQFLYRQGGL